MDSIGCSNLAIDYRGPDDIIEKTANQLTMALQPGKWSVTHDSIKPEFICEIDFDKSKK